MHSKNQFSVSGWTGLCSPSSASLPKENRMNTLESLAGFVSRLRYEDITPAAVHQVKLSLADATGCMIYGSKSEHAHNIKRSFQIFASTSGSRVFFEDWKAPAPFAALINGAMISSMAYDDLHHGATVHCGCIAVPAALAALGLQEDAVSGKDFVTALTAAYETMIRVAYSIMPEVRIRGYHPASVAAPFCSSAAVSKILKLDEEKTLHAIGIAGGLGSGLMSAQLSSDIHGMQAPYAGIHGIHGAIMSKNGVHGVRELLDDTYGSFLNTISGKHDDSWLKSVGDGKFECQGLGIKYYPTAGSVSSALDGVSAILEENSLRPDDIEEIVVRVNKSVFLHCGFDYVPGPVSGAQMNIAYCVAALLVCHEVSAAQFEPDVILNPEVAKKMALVHVVHDESMDNMGKDFGYYTKIEARANGKTFRKEIIHPKGSAQNPLSQQEVKHKFLAQCKGVIADRDLVDSIFESIMNIENIKDVQTIFDIIK